MKHSHPDTWRYGGVILRIAWEGKRAEFQSWDGRSLPADTGDTLLVFQTGDPVSLVVGVEKAQSLEVAA